MSSNDGLEMLKNWQIASIWLESNSISRFKAGRSPRVKIDEVTPSTLIVSDAVGWEPISLLDATFHVLDPTPLSALRALEITLANGNRISFIERIGGEPDA